MVTFIGVLPRTSASVSRSSSASHIRGRSRCERPFSPTWRAQMKLHEGTRFPHPVLRDNTGDSPTENFDTGITVAEVPERSEVSLAYRIELVEPKLEQLTADGL